MPALPVPADGQTLPGELVWQTVLGGWSNAYFQCALIHARLVGWHEGSAAREAERAAGE